MPATIQPDAITTVVSYRTLTTDPWTDDATLLVDRVSFELAPTVARATLSRRYGFVHETAATATAGVPDSFRGVRTALDLRGRLIRIVLTKGDQTHTWYGVCVNMPGRIYGSGTNPDTGAAIDSGITTYECFSAAWYLAKRQVTQSWVAGPAVAELAPLAVPFNLASDGELVGTRSAAIDFVSGVYFHQGVYQAGSKVASARWTGLTALEYLLALFEEETGLAFSLAAAGQHSYLANIERAWPVEGRTYWQLINDLVSPAMGFALIVEGFELRVVSVLSAAIELDSATILPANPTTVALDATSYGGAEPPLIAEIEDSHYDRIVVRGDRLRVLMTLRHHDLDSTQSTLEPDWNSTDEQNCVLTEPNEGSDKAWCQFIIPDDWDNTYNGAVQIPTVNPSIAAVNRVDQVIPATAQARWPQGLRLLRHWPRVAMSIGGFRLSTDAADLIPIQAWAEDQEGVWRQLDAPRHEYPPACTVHPLADRPGIRVRAPYPWMLSRDSGSVSAGIAVSDTGLQPVYDWRDLRITVFVQTNEHERVEVDVDDPPAGLIEKVKVIDTPEAQLWWTPQDTVLAVEADGTQRTAASLLAWTSPTVGGVLRSDRDALRKIATLAKAWYGQRRSQIHIGYQEPTIRDMLGQVIVETDTGAAVEPTGTIVSRIVYELAAKQRTTLDTEWYDLDWRRVVGARAGLQIADQGPGLHSAGIAVTPPKAPLSTGPLNPLGVLVATADDGFGGEAYRIIDADGADGGEEILYQHLQKDAGHTPARTSSYAIAGGDMAPAILIDGAWRSLDTVGCSLTYEASTRTLRLRYLTGDGTFRASTLVIASDTDSDIYLGGAYATAYGSLSLALSTAGLDWSWHLGHITLSGSAIVDFVAHCHRPVITRRGLTQNVTISGTTLRFVDGLFTSL